VQEFGTPIEGEQVCLYLSQAAKALDFLNTRRHAFEGKIVAFQHCDIKPANLLLIGDKVKLADYGLATATTAGSTYNRRAGTTDFAGPEIFQGTLSERSDQFSLGVTYCLLRTGHFPFPECRSGFKRGYVRPNPDLSGMPDAERAVVARAMAPVPQDRWSSCSEMMSQLGKLFAPEETLLGARTTPRPSYPGY
jgi:serine/threonine protein kinase